MTAIVNGIQYIGGGTAPNEFINNQSSLINCENNLYPHFLRDMSLRDYFYLRKANI